MFFFDWEGNFILNFWLGFVGLVLFFKEDNDGICLLIDLIFIIRFFICLFSLVKCWVWLIFDLLFGNCVVSDRFVLIVLS